MTTKTLSLAFAAGSWAALSQPLWAADAGDAPRDSDIIVTAPIARELGTALSGISVMSGDALTRAVQPTLGETLAHQPGVSSTAFGPNASRPILRGFQGERVRVLTDGIGSFDVSNTSVDHAVTINPLTAARIEVLRGPSALLYGSSAIGGVVNVIDSRIPFRVPEDHVHVQATATYGSAANERSVAAAADAPLGHGFVAHVDGSYDKTDDLRTGGYLLSAPLRAQALASPDAGVRSLARLSGTLPNSAGRSWDVAGALAYIGSGVDGGVSVSRHESLYGVPPRFSLDPAVTAENVRIDMGQTRVDGRLTVRLGGLFEKAMLRAGYADYRHAEIDATGAVGTQFFNKAGEARLELVQAKRGGWSGAVGAQGMIRDLHVIGDEKFLPKSRTEQIGLFTLQEVKLGRATVEAGLRYEHSRQRADADADLGNGGIARGFDTVSGSLGAGYEVAPGWRLGLNASRSQRAPSAEELFANGPHAGTQAFEVGDPALRTESSWGLEATVHGRGKGYSLDVSVFRNWFSNYIYEVATGAVQDDLPVYRNFQADARYWGVEAQARATLGHAGGAEFAADGLADYVEADIVGTGPAPRIPPLRLLGGVEATADRWSARAEVEHAFAQDRVSTLETPTPGYTVVNLNATWRPFRSVEGLTLLVSADNLTDAVVRRHASFLKDYAPLAGRDVRVTVKFAM